MLEEFLKFIQRHELFTRNQRLLVGVSGGIDSVVLCELLHQARVKFGIAHCNFHLRGGESDADDLFVSTLAMKYDVPFFRNDFDTKAFAEEQGISTQMAARDLRFKWFEEVRLKEGFDYIAIASQLNDDIETVLINLSRGTGIRGITGIPVKNRTVVRPLLFASRDEVKEFAKEHELQWREDSSNDSVVYFRNNIRKNVIPVLKEGNPSLERTFQQNLESFKQVQELLDWQVAEAINTSLHREGRRTVINIEALKEYNPLKLFLFEILQPFGFNSDHVENLIHVINGIPGKQFFSDTHALTVDREEIFIDPIVDEQSRDRIQIEGDTTFINSPISLGFERISIDNFELVKKSNIAQLDADKLEFPLLLRKWHPGDAFHPLGMNQRKKISDFFIDIKLPLNKKQETYVLISGGDIVWIVGHRIDHRYRVTEETKSVYLVK